MAGNTGEPGRTVTSKLAAILIALGNGRQFTLTELARQTNIPVSTAWRLLNDLLGASLVERADDGSYRPGRPLRSLAHDTTPPTLRERAPFIVDDLSSVLHRTVRLGVLDELEVAYVEKGPGATPGSLFPNSARLPLHASAMGKVLLAFAPRPLIQLVTTVDLPRYTARTVTCPLQLRHNLRWVKMHGYAVTEGELSATAGAVGVPVFSSAGTPIAAIEVEVLTHAGDTGETLLPALVMAAQCLSRELGAYERSGNGPEREVASRGGANPVSCVDGTLRESRRPPRQLQTRGSGETVSRTYGVARNALDPRR
jgi:DNA-binding IclR family transcriptional regulator